MIEDINDYGQSKMVYKEQTPLKPPMMPPSSIRATVSPRFDSLMGRSNSVAWSPAPLDGNGYDRSHVNPLTNGQTYTKSEVWVNNNNNNNNQPVRPSDVWINSNPMARPPNGWTNNNPNAVPSNTWINYNSNSTPPNGWTSNNNPNSKPPDNWVNNNMNSVSSNGWVMNNTYTKSSEVWANNKPPPKPAEPSSTINTGKQITESTIFSNNSSTAPMLKSPKSNSTCGYFIDGCSPRCKLGLLGFVIGFLAVGIALAVVLVLWLRE